MHNSSHVSRLQGNLSPNDEPKESASDVVNHRQHVDALPDKYDNCRPLNERACRAGGGGVVLTYDFMDARTFRASPTKREGREKNKKERTGAGGFHGNPAFPLTDFAFT